jgi:Predicted transcriptional regulators
MKIPFYLLGLLIRYGPQHGYRLKQIIEETVSDFAKIKLPTIYYHLNKLKEQGYVTETMDRDGNRPEKMVYSITVAGREHYGSLFIKQLKESYSPEFALDGVLYFRDCAKRDELLRELERKQDDLEKKLKALKQHENSSLENMEESWRFSAEAIFEHHRIHLEAELIWLKKLTQGL